MERLESLKSKEISEREIILDFKKHFPNTIHEDDENAENGVVQWSLHAECDFDSKIADINLGGANAVHYKALSFL